MKILFFNNNLSGLINFRKDIIHHLSEQGHEIVLVAPPDTTKQAILNSLFSCDIRFVPLEINRTSINPVKDIALFLRVRSVIRKERPDYVFNFTIKPNIYGALAAHSFHIPCSDMMPGMGYAFVSNGIVSKVARMLYRYALKTCEHIIVLNKENKNLIQRLKLCDEKKIILLKGGEGVNLEQYPFHGNTGQNTNFLFVGRVIAEKGYREFVKAASIVKAQYPDTTFTVVGAAQTYEMHPIPHEEIEHDVSQGTIDYKGEISDMQSVYQTPGTVMVIPSYYKEGLNRSLMEGCASGMPIITTDQAGCRETVEDGVNGYLVDIHDIEGLTKAMIRYIELPDKQKREMSLASRRIAEQRFDVRDTFNVYDQIIHQHTQKKQKIFRISTVPASLNTFCRGLLKELSENYDVVALSSPGEQLDEIAQREGVRTIAVPMQRHISLISDIKSMWQMYKVMRHERPDMVHSMTPKAGLISMVAAWMAHVPTRVHTFTGLVWPTSTGLKRRVLMATDWLTCACATHVIPEGEGVKNDLLTYGITHKDIQVLGYGNVRGIDLDYYDRTLFPAKNEDGCFTFVFIGRIVRDKGVNELISAFDRLHSTHPATRLVLVGPTEDELDPVSSDTRRRIEHGDGIEAVGRQNDVRPYYAAADALVFPSYREGFPNVVIEAGAMGLPSIVTNINGSREIIIQGKNGIIIPPCDEDALHAAMKRWVEHPEEVAAMAAQARLLIASRYEQEYVRKCLKDFYKDVLAS